MDRGNYETNSVFDNEKLERLPLPCFVTNSNWLIIAYNTLFADLVAGSSEGEDKETAIQALVSECEASDQNRISINGQFYHQKTRTESGENTVLLYPSSSKTEYRQLEEEKQSYNTQKEGILAAVPDLIYIISKDGTYLDCRAQNEKDLPIPLDMIVGSSFWDMPESIELKEMIWRKIQIALQTGETQTVEYQRNNRLGHLQYYESRISRSDERTAVYFVRNITERVDAQKQLAFSEQKWKSIVENGYDGIVLINRDGRIKYASTNTQEFLGENPTTLSAQGAITLFPGYRTRLIRLFYAIIEGRTLKHSMTLQLTDQLGMIRYLESSWISRLDDASINSIIINFREITRQVDSEMKLLNHQKTIETILKTTSAGILILDQLNITYTNNQFAELLGYAQAELLNTSIEELTVADDKLGVIQRAEMRARGDNSQLHYKVRGLHKDGSTRWLDVHSATIEYQNKQATIATVFDITEQQGIEQKLIQAKDSAEELARLKSSFLANMSHEIRTPLNGVLGLAELISMSDDLSEIQEFVTLQKESGVRLLNTLTSILDLSRLEAENNELKLTPVNLNDILLATWKQFRIQFEKKGLILELNLTDEAIICHGDEAMLNQIMNNLVGNALKFTNTGACTIRLSLVQIQKNSHIQIEVEDTGIGMSSEFVPHVFDTFRQEKHGNSRKYEGSGLGLAITQKYINLLNGSIRLKSKKNEGSCFSILLPYKNKN